MKRSSSSSTSDPATKRARDAAPTLDKPALRSLAAELSAPQHAIDNAVALLVDGHTVPFIARYRQQQTGGLEPPALRRLEDALKDAAALQSRLATILTALRRSERLTADLEAALRGCATLSALEDVYAPHKARPCTLAEKARALGAEPAANALWAATVDDGGLRALVRSSGANEQALLDGAAKILAERLAKEIGVRAAAKTRFERCAVVKSTGAAGADAAALDKYRDFANDYERPLHAVPSHAWLALHRGAEQKLLKLSVAPRDAAAVADAVTRAAPPLRAYHSRSGGGCGKCVALVRAAAADAWTRLLRPSLSRELQRAALEKARGSAIDCFAANLSPLLLAPPLRAARATLGVDPGFAHGHKLAVVANASGAVLAHATVHTPLPSRGGSGRGGGGRGGGRGGGAALILIQRMNITAVGSYCVL